MRYLFVTTFPDDLFKIVDLQNGRRTKWFDYADFMEIPEIIFNLEDMTTREEYENLIDKNIPCYPFSELPNNPKDFVDRYPEYFV